MNMMGRTMAIITATRPNAKAGSLARGGTWDPNLSSAPISMQDKALKNFETRFLLGLMGDGAVSKDPDMGFTCETQRSSLGCGDTLQRSQSIKIVLGKLNGA